MQLILNIDEFEEALYQIGIDQNELANEAGLNPNTLSHAKKEGKTVRPITARKIMKVLGDEFDFHNIFKKKERVSANTRSIN